MPLHNRPSLPILVVLLLTFLVPSATGKAQTFEGIPSTNRYFYVNLDTLARPATVDEQAFFVGDLNDRLGAEGYLRRFTADSLKEVLYLGRYRQSADGSQLTYIDTVTGAQQLIMDMRIGVGNIYTVADRDHRRNISSRIVRDGIMTVKRVEFDAAGRKTIVFNEVLRRSRFAPAVSDTLRWTEGLGPNYGWFKLQDNPDVDYINTSSVIYCATDGVGDLRYYDSLTMAGLGYARDEWNDGYNCRLDCTDFDTSVRNPVTAFPFRLQNPVTPADELDFRDLRGYLTIYALDGRRLSSVQLSGRKVGLGSLGNYRGLVVVHLATAGGRGYVSKVLVR